MSVVTAEEPRCPVCGSKNVRVDLARLAVYCRPCENVYCEVCSEPMDEHTDGACP